MMILFRASCGQPGDTTIYQILGPRPYVTTVHRICRLFQDLTTMLIIIVLYYLYDTGQSIPPRYAHEIASFRVFNKNGS